MDVIAHTHVDRGDTRNPVQTNEQQRTEFGMDECSDLERPTKQSIRSIKPARFGADIAPIINPGLLHYDRTGAARNTSGKQQCGKTNSKRSHQEFLHANEPTS